MLDPLMIWLASISPWLALAFSVGLLVSVSWVISWAWTHRGPLPIIICIITFPAVLIGIALGAAGAIVLINDLRDWITGNR